jgi:diaminohydroxyphosphoribosylaminopyrimidine deaminase/5-amino-6-(5-phosphoribosylamino)uracil reductase
MNESFMKRCIDLALNGTGQTYPNPMVGAVVVSEGKIIGEGYHRRAGEPHAEVHAVNSVKDKSLLRKSTLYINLEPCCHSGKTPPCTDLILTNKIPRVVMGAIDTSSKINGKGIRILREGGCEVITGLLEAECRFLNRRFFTFHEKKRPYIILKWAQTSDGFIDSERKTGKMPVWITNQLAKMLVHKWRSEESAIMVGSNTIMRDNPRLTVREWTGRQPVRIIFDRMLELPANLNVFDRQTPAIVFTLKQAASSANLEYITISNEKNYIESILEELYRRELLSIIIEGGNRLLTDFISVNLWDEARVFTGNRLFHKGIKAPVFEYCPVSTEMVEDSRLDIFLGCCQGKRIAHFLSI